MNFHYFIVTCVHTGKPMARDGDTGEILETRELNEIKLFDSEEDANTWAEDLSEDGNDYVVSELYAHIE